MCVCNRPPLLRLAQERREARINMYCFLGWMRTETPDDVIFTEPETGESVVFNREDMRWRVMCRWENPGTRARHSEQMKAYWAARRRARA
jgi:hypothetical protein